MDVMFTVHTCIDWALIMDVMLGYCLVHTCKGLVELGISLLGIDHGCHVGILLCGYM